MKTRDELLAMADEYLGYAKSVGDDVASSDILHERVQAVVPWVIAYTQVATACVMLARELREGIEPVQ